MSDENSSKLSNKKYIKKIYDLTNIKFTKYITILSLTLISSFLDLAGLGLIGFYTTLIISDKLIFNNNIIFLINFLKFNLNKENILIVIGVIIFLVFLFKSIIIIFINYKITTFSYQREIYLREKLLKGYQNMEYEDYIKNDSSLYLTSIGAYLNVYGAVLKSILKILSDAIIGIIIIVYLAFHNFLILSILAILFSLLILIYRITFLEKIKLYGKNANEGDREMMQGVREFFSTFKENKLFGYQNYFYNLIINGAKKIANNNTKFLVISTSPRYILELIIVFFLISTVVIMIMLKYDLENIVPIITIFSLAALRLLPIVNQFILSLSQLSYGKNAISILHKDFSNYNFNEFKGEKDNNQKEKINFENLILENIYYKYEENNNYILKNINLSINKNETIGIIGSSGSGKTTLIDIILGLLKPTKGKILINNKSVNELFYKELFAYLPQNSNLLNTSIKKNIAIGINDKNIDDKKISTSMNQSNIFNYVKGLPDNEETIIGENGVKLSGGQKQRISLARSFYFDRDILVLDESTSALDNETEKEIINELNKFRKQKTIIIISHKFSILKNCDKIFKIENNQISNELKYKDLINL